MLWILIFNWGIIILFRCISLASCYCILKLFFSTICIGSLADLLTALATLGTLIVACVSVWYVDKQYNKYIDEERTKLLCEYNHRYSTDKNIQNVISWMLNVSIVNDKGEITGADPCRCFRKPDVNTKELFMRFFEELNLQMKNKKLDEDDVFRLFAYYALVFEEYKDFRLDITDYKTTDELKKMQDGCDKKKYTYLWSGYRGFVDKMNKKRIEMENDVNTK